MTNKITKTMKLDAIVLMAQGQALPEGITAEMLVEFAEHEKSLLAKKTSGKTKAQTEADAKLDMAILEAMAEFTEGVTTTAIADKVKATATEFASLSTSKTTARLGALAKDGKVFREVVKGKALYSLV